MERLKAMLAIAALVSICFLSSCNRAPKASDIIGKYYLDKASIEYLKNEKKYTSIPESFIEIFSDNSIVINKMPDCVLDGFGKSSGKYYSGKGIWEIEITTWENELIFEIYKGSELKPGIYRMVRIKKSNPYILELYVGDPDSGNSIYYKMAS